MQEDADHIQLGLNFELHHFFIRNLSLVNKKVIFDLDINPLCFNQFYSLYIVICNGNLCAAKDEKMKKRLLLLKFPLKLRRFMLNLGVEVFFHP